MNNIVNIKVFTSRVVGISFERGLKYHIYIYIYIYIYKTYVYVHIY